MITEAYILKDFTFTSFIINEKKWQQKALIAYK